MADNRLNVKISLEIKMRIHVFDTGRKTLWENYSKGSDRGFS